MPPYRLETSRSTNGDLLKVTFGESAENDEIVRYVAARIEEMKAGGALAGGKLLRINGPASLPVCMTITHALAHLYGALAWYDPKMGKYVVAVAHDPDRRVGDLIDFDADS